MKSVGRRDVCVGPILHILHDRDEDRHKLVGFFQQVGEKLFFDDLAFNEQLKPVGSLIKLLHAALNLADELSVRSRAIGLAVMGAN